MINKFIKDKYAGERRSFLIELGYGATVSEGVQEIMIDGKNRHSTADAILISTFAHKLITKFYLRHYKPTNPTEVFNSASEAIEWIGKLR